MTDAVLIAVFFPSYSFPNKPQPLWEHISKQKPDLWVWLGDGMFANTSMYINSYLFNLKAYKCWKTSTVYFSILNFGSLLDLMQGKCSAKP